MFDILAKLFSSVASFLFPLFASYKALKTSDPAQLTPWLMYWVVLACALLVESWTEWILVWVPLYPWIRLFFLLYLVLPQTQGARLIYTQHIHPRLEENESQIEDFIATTHDRLKAAGLAYLRRALEFLRTHVLGMPPTPESHHPSAPAGQQPRSYTQALLDRFQLPQARWSGSGGSAGQDLYNLLAGAVNAASSALNNNTNSANSGASSSGAGRPAAPSAFATPATGVGAFPDLTASGTLVPPSIQNDADKMSFLAAQRDRISAVLHALDREAQQIQAGTGTGASRRRDQQSSSSSGDNDDDDERRMDLDGQSTPPAGLGREDTARPPTSMSGASGLSKSRSEADFEKIDAESGTEDNDAARHGGGEARSPPAAAGGGGSWLPWGWGSGGSGSSVGAQQQQHAKSE